MGRSASKFLDVFNPSIKDLETYFSQQQRAPRSYSLDDLRRATKNFSSGSVISRGARGIVHRGKLQRDDGVSVLVAVKRYHKQFLKEFQVELNVLSRLNHRNIIRYLGYCVQKECKLLVLEFMCHGSLYSYLHAEQPTLSWTQKLSIALGIVQGLKYLRLVNVVHRDPNSSNILLDRNLVPKIAGFSSCVKAYRTKDDRSQIPATGTKGYIDPDHGSGGDTSTAVDVYVFGVVLMELFTGKPPISRGSDILLVTEMKERCKSGSDFSDLANLNGSEFTSLRVTIDLAMRCTSNSAQDRPSLNEVAFMLEEALRLHSRA